MCCTKRSSVVNSVYSVQLISEWSISWSLFLSHSKTSDKPDSTCPVKHASLFCPAFMEQSIALTFGANLTKLMSFDFKRDNIN
jgi:hypothetical protein